MIGHTGHHHGSISSSAARRCGPGAPGSPAGTRVAMNNANTSGSTGIWNRIDSVNTRRPGDVPAPARAAP